MCINIALRQQSIVLEHEHERLPLRFTQFAQLQLNPEIEILEIEPYIQNTSTLNHGSQSRPPLKMRPT